MENKKKLLLVVDTENWAFFNNASNIQRELDDYFDIDIVAMERLNWNVADLFLIAKDYDLIHFFWRGFLLDLNNNFTRTYIYNLGISKEEFINRYVKNKIITTAVYDHKLLENNIINEYTEYVNAYYTSSTILNDLYLQLDLNKYPIAIITDGIDLTRFKSNAKAFKNIRSRTISIGWAGNSKWDGENDHKGLNTIIKPAVEELIKEGYPLKLHLADSSVKFRNKKEMEKYYSEIDLYICCSVNEGTPNPILEAFACGIPVITTDVGIVRDLFGKLQKEYIMKERSVEELKTQIIKFLDNLDDIEKISNENLNRIEKWAWKYKARDFKEFIDKVIG